MHCYLCRSTENLTRDHIPPRGFFPTPRPKNLITVPCCLKCNNAFSNDDDVVRLWLSAHPLRSAAGEWIWENRVIPNTVRRRPGFVDQLLSTSKEILVQTSSGKIDVTAHEIDRDILDRFLIRTAKGLITHHHPNHDYATAAFSVRHIEPTPLNLQHLDVLRQHLPYHFRGDGVLQYRGGLTDSGMSGMWLLVFYETSLFLVAHTKNKWGAES